MSKGSRDNVLAIVYIAAIMVTVIIAGISGMEKSDRNREKMLCESARVSGNVEYLTKCEGGR